MIKLFKKIYHRYRDYNSKRKLKQLVSKGLKVGKNFNIYDSYIDYGFSYLIEIGDDVTITNSSILSHDASTQNIINKSKIAKVKIGNNVFIGWGSIILPGVSIGNNVIVGAGTVIGSGSKIPNNSIVVGNPCKIIGKYVDFENKHINGMKNHPVYNTHWKYKEEDEINRMIIELDNTYGYDE